MTSGNFFLCQYFEIIQITRELHYGVSTRTEVCDPSMSNIFFFYSFCILVYFFKITITLLTKQIYLEESNFNMPEVYINGHPVSVWKLFRGQMKWPGAQVLHQLQEKNLSLSRNGQRK